MKKLDQTGCVYWVHRKTETNVKTQGYIGVTVKLSTRKISHLSEARLGTHCNKYFARALLKYEDIEWEVLFTGPIEGCYQLEEYFRPLPLLGWNLIEGGKIAPTLGKHHSQEVRDKISKKVKQYFVDNPEATENLRRLRIGNTNYLGCTHSVEVRKKISDKVKESYLNNPTTLVKLQKRMKETPTMAGKTHSDLTKQKMSANARKRKAVKCVETEVIYAGVTEAYKAMGLKTHTPLAKAARDGSKSAGYHWEYVDATANA